MSQKSRGPLRLLLAAAIAFPVFGCGESKPEIPANTPAPPAGKDPGPPTAAQARSGGPRTSRPSAGRWTACSMTGTVTMAPIPARAAPAAAKAPR